MVLTMISPLAFMVFNLCHFSFLLDKSGQRCFNIINSFKEQTSSFIDLFYCFSCFYFIDLCSGCYYLSSPTWFRFYLLFFLQSL